MCPSAIENSPELTFNEKLQWFGSTLLTIVKTYWLAIVFGLLLFHVFKLNYKIQINKSESIHATLMLLHIGQHVHKGDIATFRWDGWGPLPYPDLFSKYVVGEAGDQLTRVDHTYYINGKEVAIAKDVGLTGTKLTMNPIPPEGYKLKTGEYFMTTSHPYSLDSRYVLPGIITEDKIVGRAEIIF